MRRGKPCRKPSVMRCLAAKKRAAVCITTGKRKRFFLMGRVDRLLPVVGAVLRAGLLVLPVSAHAGDAGGGGHARFAIKPMGVGGDVKARLWDVVSVASLISRSSVRILRHVILGRSELFQRFFGLVRQAAGRLTRAAHGTRIGRRHTGAWMIRRGEMVLASRVQAAAEPLLRGVAVLRYAGRTDKARSGQNSTMVY
jgi:hypothetical protein